jgi:hypothetical protein
MPVPGPIKYQVSVPFNETLFSLFQFLFVGFIVVKDAADFLYN